MVVFDDVWFAGTLEFVNVPWLGIFVDPFVVFVGILVVFIKIVFEVFVIAVLCFSWALVVADVLLL